MENSRLIFLIIAMFFMTFLLKSQVTIGTETIARAALLQLKTKNVSQPSGITSDDNITSSEGGLLLPRVKLRNINTLEPFISANDNEWINNNTLKVGETHAGLVVYNLTNDFGFAQGVYVWNGNRWEKAISDNSTKVINGLSMDGEAPHLGGDLVKSTTIDVGNNNLAVKGKGTLNVSSPLIINSTFNYSVGAGKGKALTSDKEGNVLWMIPGSFSSTPTAVFSSLGITPTLGEGKRLQNTRTYIILPPGRWFVAVTMLALQSGYSSGYDSRFWMTTTFVEEGDDAPQDDNFENGNMYVSGELSLGYNILNGFVIMKNESNVPKKFYYYFYESMRLDRNSSKAYLQEFGRSTWGENSIVAFDLR